MFGIIIVTQGRVVNGGRRHAEPPGGNDHPQQMFGSMFVSEHEKTETFSRGMGICGYM
jgi:hypothetical protein